MACLFGREYVSQLARGRPIETAFLIAQCAVTDNAFLECNSTKVPKYAWGREYPRPKLLKRSSRLPAMMRKVFMPLIMAFMRLVQQLVTYISTRPAETYASHCVYRRQVKEVATAKPEAPHGRRFYSGGQFMPGGGRAPKGGAWAAPRAPYD